ncbi:hypothetical protein ACO22_02967 [Paracoccidioides brasiliensis]|uniref:Uncharacterized protein n=1 Tax=Paracoccidioides brasiliensis TaxID=121759 RepID=A0A1D2JH81_PARBR|nr:hypothetical protein ACO22_02967 [Paracoccidioides brasiliensis]ODH50539.1 hypothetical protein GX48_03357 [Paracoccidioides brasiliensis]
MDDCPQESEMTIDGRLGEIGRQLEEFDNDFREIETEFNNINIRFNDLDRRHDDVEGLFQEVDARFDEVNTLFDGVDAQFTGVENRCDDIDNWCDRADKRFDGLEQDLRDVVAELANSKAMNANRVLRRIHQRINQVQVRTLMPLGLRKFEWKSHPKMPKHMKELFYLGQRAKGVFESAFSGDKPIETQRALQTIRDLAAFYEVVIYSDEQADGEGAGVDVTGDVDGYMEELLDKWGLDWTKVCEIVEERVLNPQTQQARIKRSASLNGVEAQVSVRRHS